MRERNESIDCLKGITILCVMFGHVQVHNHMTDPYLYDIIKSIQMPMFFLINGYLTGTGTKIQNLEQYKMKIRKRTVSYLLPFFSWLVIQHISYVIQAFWTVLFQLDYGLWFLVVLFLFTWMAYTAQLAQAKWEKEWVFWLVFLGGCLCILVAYLCNIKFLSPSLLIIYIPYYTTAYFVGLYLDSIKKWIPALWQKIAAIVGGVIFLLMVKMLDLVTVTSFYMLGLQTLASFLGCYFVIYFVLEWKENKIKKKLAILGRYTLEIYVLHYQFATILNPNQKSFVFWSRLGLLYSLAAFVAMSAVTAVGIKLINLVPVLRLLLFGKGKEQRSAMAYNRRSN